MKRYALVRNARTRREAEAYLPGNYEVIAELSEHEGEWGGPDGAAAARWDRCAAPAVFVIQGEDAFGWGLDSYVIPRYASGLIWAEEIDLSHPAMKQVPVA